MNFIFPVLVLALFAFMMWKRRGDITPDEARALISDGAILVDVRTPGEFNSRHIPGARNIPLNELTGRARELEPKDKTVILYCQSGARSGMAKGVLKRAGWQSVHNLGAISRW